MSGLANWDSRDVRRGVGIVLVCLAIQVGGGFAPGIAQAANRDPFVPEPIDLAEVPLEELLNMTVTSVSKREQPFSEAAAALFVLTQEDLRRSGANSIPEALRMVPGLSVAKVDGNKWAISARGFQGRFGNKLLVLIDGRTVYSPTTAGVHWDAQDTILEDIERIEIIRGPAAALWGVNAVNGVINIITKNAKATQGALVTVGGGTEERAFTGMRYGLALSEKTHLRIFGKMFARDNQVLANDDVANDRWQQGRGGMRLDHTASNGDQLTLQGEYYNGQYHETVNLPTLSAPFTELNKTSVQSMGGNLLARWTHTDSATAGYSVQVYYDRFQLRAIRGAIHLDTADLNYQQHAAWGRQQFVWGLGYRAIHSRTVTGENVLGFTVEPYKAFNVWSGFVQDDITVVPDTVVLTLGSKFEHNDFTGWTWQPTARVRWMATESQTLWGAFSRSVRAPAQQEQDVLTHLPSGNATPFGLVGNRQFGNENVLTYQVGYRNQLTAELSVDVAAYYNNYNDLRTFEPGAAISVAGPPVPHSVTPLYFSNKMHGETYGVEVFADWRPLDWWRIQPSYSYLRMDLYAEASGSRTATNAEGESPAHQLSVRSLMSLPYRTELDLWGRYVDRLQKLNVPSYVTLDVRLGWRPSKEWEVSLVGQNLLDNRRLEFREGIVSYLPTEVQRGVYGKVTWRW